MSNISRLNTVLDALAGEPPAKFDDKKLGAITVHLTPQYSQFWPDNPDRTIDDSGMPSDFSPELSAGVLLGWLNLVVDSMVSESVREKIEKEVQDRLTKELGDL